MAENHVIGREGDMPWSVPSDLKRYRRLTMDKPMIMGRKTLESIGRLLDGRDTIVLSRDGTVPFEGAYSAKTPDEALQIAADCARSRETDEIVIAGGGEIYRLFMDRIDTLYVTEIAASPDGDAKFPDIDPAVFERVSLEAWAQGERDSAATRFGVWRRIQPAG
ncbi:dihydrofolate reductase [Jiella sp. MQZ9-1]|uniref:Dihydrofolate reductase n=2 Tax=Jiella flava TaxID=2816857 RepID=A0A939JVY0_9HYPH|nr:dihydrofolate reductase [Jiella flava]MCD2470372.1 dihydrofolate reductase [Jiella flava]